MSWSNHFFGNLHTGLIISFSISVSPNLGKKHLQSNIFFFLNAPTKWQPENSVYQLTPLSFSQL